MSEMSNNILINFRDPKPEYILAQSMLAKELRAMSMICNDLVRYDTLLSFVSAHMPHFKSLWDTAEFVSL